MSDVTKNRNRFIGGSDVAAILGLSQYKTPYEVWEEKKHGINTFSGNPATEWGKKLEPVIVDHCEQVNGFKITERNSKYISREYDFLGCHPDGIEIIKQILIEAKTVSEKAFKNWQNEIPLEYFCQVQHNLFCTGLQNAKFICLVLDSRHYFEIDVSRHDEYINLMNKSLIEWWNRYIIGDEVPIKIVQDFEKLNPKQSIIEADEETIKNHTDLLILKSKIKELDEQKESIEEKLKLKLGDATDLMSGLNTLATWRSSTTVKIDTKKLKEELPETFLKYAKETTSRRFLVKQ